MKLRKYIRRYLASTSLIYNLRGEASLYNLNDNSFSFVKSVIDVKLVSYLVLSEFVMDNHSVRNSEDFSAQNELPLGTKTLTSPLLR